MIYIFSILPFSSNSNKIICRPGSDTDVERLKYRVLVILYTENLRLIK